MPRRPMTAEQKATKSLAMKAAWKRRKAAAVTTPTNGLVVTTQIVLQLQGHDLTLTRDEAASLYEALRAVCEVTVPNTTSLRMKKAWLTRKRRAAAIPDVLTGSVAHE